MALVSGTDSPLPPLNPMPRSVVMSEVNAYAQFLAGWPQQPINVVFGPASDEQRLQSLIAAPGARNIPLQFAYTGGSEVVVRRNLMRPILSAPSRRAAGKIEAMGTTAAHGVVMPRRGT
jgi:hypothetical protein